MDRSDRRDSDHRNVLLVDDAGGITSHRRRLEASGYHVTNASDLDVALTIARQAPPRIIFLAARRLGSERTPFLQALRRDDHTRHIPVIVLSNDVGLDRLGLSRVGRELW